MESKIEKNKHFIAVLEELITRFGENRSLCNIVQSLQSENKEIQTNLTQKISKRQLSIQFPATD